MPLDLLAGLDSQARKVVGGWLAELRTEDRSFITNIRARNITRELSRWRRADPHAILLGWAIGKIRHGYSVEDLEQGGGHEGGYLISIGVGKHGIMERTLKYDEVGVHLRGRGIHVERLRDLYRDARLELERRASGQGALFPKPGISR